MFDFPPATASRRSLPLPVLHPQFFVAHVRRVVRKLGWGSTCVSPRCSASGHRVRGQRRCGRLAAGEHHARRHASIAARALANLLTDPCWVSLSPDVLGRAQALPCFIHFIFSYQTKCGKIGEELKTRTDFCGRSLGIYGVFDVGSATLKMSDVGFEFLLISNMM